MNPKNKNRITWEQGAGLWRIDAGTYAPVWVASQALAYVVAERLNPGGDVVLTDQPKIADVVPLNPTRWTIRSSRPGAPGFVEYPDTFPTTAAAATFALEAFPCIGQSGAWEWATEWGSVWLVPTTITTEVAA